MTAVHPTAPVTGSRAVLATRPWWGLSDIPAGFGPSVVTVGVFDGVHRGHQQLLAAAAAEGRRRGLPTVLVTFDPHPARIVGPPRNTSTLTTPTRRAELAGHHGIDQVLVLSFDRELAGQSPEDFATRVLAHSLQATAVVVGSDFRFGACGRGDVPLLDDLGAEHGWAVTGIPLHGSDGARVSSTRVRAALGAGDVAAATQLLGRPHRLDGFLVPVHIGSSDLHITDPAAALPAPGTYRARATGATPGPTALVEIEVLPDGRVHVPPTAVRPTDRSGAMVSLEMLDRA